MYSKLALNKLGEIMIDRLRINDADEAFGLGLALAGVRDRQELVASVTEHVDMFYPEFSIGIIDEIMSRYDSEISESHSSYKETDESFASDLDWWMISW